jgi:predicted MPP superfamily phosphohydrolase
MKRQDPDLENLFDAQLYERLKARFDHQHLNRRLTQQESHTILQFRGGFHVYWENFDWLAWPLLGFLKMTNLVKQGLKNTLEYQIITQDVSLPNLPPSFEGYTICQLSDLHIDGIWDHGKKLCQLIKGLKFDLCVITGDFRFLTFGPVLNVVAYTRRLVQAISCPDGIIGILGNHDGIEMVPDLEDSGIRMLVNESLQLNRGNDGCIGIAGVDDEHFYAQADLNKACAGIKRCPVKILLAHSQEVIKKAAEAGMDYYLCGHTHGGQICLPTGIMVIKNAPPHLHGPYIKGAWRYQNMAGYTSRGVGASVLPVRFHCPPEITLHRLKRA